MQNSLQTKVGNVVLQSPLLLASGYLTETPEFYQSTANYCAGMVTRSLKKNPPPERRRTPAPRYVIFDDGYSMLNCEWGNSEPWQKWHERWVDDVYTNGAIIVSLSGRDIDSCSELIEIFNYDTVDAYEINISCSHSGAVHGNLNTDIEHLKELLGRIRGLTDNPIWIKLSYSSFLLEMAKTAEEYGADAIVCTNSIGPGLLIDTETGLPKLGIKGGAGGVTGRAIFPIAMNCVYQLAQTVKIPIVGIGGIFTADDVLQMMMAGASAVQLYTAPALKGPSIFKDIRDGLEGWLESHGYGSIKDIIGKAIGKATDNSFVSLKPTFDRALCVRCGDCSRACNFGAIKDLPSPDYSKCVGCNACVGVCPSGALKAHYERR